MKRILNPCIASLLSVVFLMTAASVGAQNVNPRAKKTEVKVNEMDVIYDEDDYEDLIAGYTSIEDIHGLIINYVKDAQKDKSEDDDQIVDVRLYNQDYFILQSTLPEAEAESFTEKLGEFLISKNVKNLELYTACYSYTLVEGETKINIDYKISLLIKDGVMTLEASSND